MSGASSHFILSRNAGLMKKFVILCFTILTISALHAEEFASSMELEYRLAHGQAESFPDSSALLPHPSLLPSNISFMERTLWGETGVLRTTGIFPSLTPDERKSELRLRRTMLSIHQIGGFVTLGLMASAAYCGQQVLNGNRQYYPAHKFFVGSTILSYTATGMLSVLSPPPLIRRDEFSTITVHKTLAWVHFIGMVVTPIIGASLKHSMNYDQLARYHQISAYVTTAALAAAMISVTF
jgi:hypothetical protein